MKLWWKQIIILLLVVIITLINMELFAQDENLPSRIGTYRLGYRGFAQQTHKYNDQGKLEPLAAPLNQDFSGKNLLEGVGGDELQKLAKILHAIDVNSSKENSLLNELYLGKLRGKVTGNISAYFIAIAYGISDYWTILGGIPWVKAKVNADVWFEPGRDPRTLESRIGEVGAFTDLKEGLAKAANITTQTIKSTIEAKGYEPIDKPWVYEGVGDAIVGSILARSFYFNPNVRSIQSLTTTLSIPTGYVDNPDILTDVSIGKGYYQLSNRISQRIAYKYQYWFGLDLTYGYSFPTEITKRVPKDNESLVDEERKVTVNLKPGSDWDGGITVGYIFSIFKLQYKLGFKEHTKDYYSGPIEGNYNKLSEGSNMTQIYHEPSIILDTVNSFKNKQFPIPMMIFINAHLPIKAQNSLDERYVEISLQSFFAIPKSSSNMTIAKNNTNNKTLKITKKSTYQNKKVVNKKHSKQHFYKPKKSYKNQFAVK